MRKKNGAVPVTLAPYSARLYQEVMPALDPDEKKAGQAGRAGSSGSAAKTAGPADGRTKVAGPENGGTEASDPGEGRAKEGIPADRGKSRQSAGRKSRRTHSGHGENRKDK